MIFYFSILFLVSIIFILIHYSKNELQKMIILYLGPMLILIFVAGLRDGIGTDYHNYLNIYKNINSAVNLEKGYYFINIIFKRLDLPFSIVIFITSFITMLLIFVTIKKYSKYWFISSFIFVTNFNLYFRTFTAIQQYIAIAIFFFSIRYIINRDLYKFLLCVLLGFLFHKSMLFILPFYFLLNINYNKFWLISLIVISYVFQKIKFIILFMKYFESYIPFGYRNYINSHLNQRMSFDTGFFFIFNLLVFLIIIILYKNNKNNQIFINGYLYYFIIFLMTQNYSTFARLSWYFQVFSIIVIPNFVYTLRPKTKQLVLTILVAAHLLVFWKGIYTAGIEIVPYRIILFN